MYLYSFPYDCWLRVFLAAVELNNKITCAAVIPILPLLYSCAVLFGRPCSFCPALGSIARSLHIFTRIFKQKIDVLLLLF